MAGIGFELRKLYREHGLVNQLKAYAYSSLTTTGPMILCMLLVLAVQRIMTSYGSSYDERMLYISTVQYSFIFSIILTSGMSMLLTRYISDMIFEKRFDRLLASYYGVLMIMLPINGIIAWIFLRGMQIDVMYKLASYFFFMLLTVIWFQSVYLSALKDYMRIVRNFVLGMLITLGSLFLLLQFTSMDITTSALIAMDIGFFIIAVNLNLHFEMVFPAGKQQYFFEFLSYFKKHPFIFFIGTFMYAGIYVHNFVYWFSDHQLVVADRYILAPSYDLPAFFALLSVMPTLITFVVSVETRFYEKYRDYYGYVLGGGALQQISQAKKDMQRVLMREIGLMMEIQLLFTFGALALGIKLLPATGFSMEQLDTFIILVFSFYLFIMMLEVLLLLLYFDDQKGVLFISATFVCLNIGLSIWMLVNGHDGYGLFYASLVGMAMTIARLIYVLRNIDYYTFCSQPLKMRHGERDVSRRLNLKVPSAVIALIAIPVLLTGCMPTNAETSAGGPQAAASESGISIAEPAKGIVEDKRIYEADIDSSVKKMYITILPESDNPSRLTWYDMNRNAKLYLDERLDIILQEGDENGTGPAAGLLGFGETLANADIEIRGKSSRSAAQKSYKIRLHDKTGLWMDQKVINLNKHAFDMTRLSNKLSFDLFENIPNFTSLRTQFVQLYVRDLSEGSTTTEYEDYGLYTHIEQPNKRFLKNHWLDPYGQLYKIKFFEYRRYPDLLKSQNDPTYDKKAFETILEIKGREDHDKLLAMLDDVNNMSIPIDEVMAKHFDLDNYLTWMAVNLLTDNMDTDANNHYLYSPLNSDTWYFLPWDYDGGWGLHRKLGSQSTYQAGLSNYWAGVLHNRYFRTEEHVQQLIDKMNEIHEKYINERLVKEQLDEYLDIVKGYVESEPDRNYLPESLSTLEEVYAHLPKIPQIGIDLFMQDLEKPKPFFMGTEITDSNDVIFRWENSFDLQGDDLEYDLLVALDPAITNVILKKEGLTVTEYTHSGFESGEYFWKVVVRDSKGNEQIAFDMYMDEDENGYYGVLPFEVK